MWTFRLAEVCPICLRLAPPGAFSETIATVGIAPEVDGGKLTKLGFTDPSSSIIAARTDWEIDDSEEGPTEDADVPAIAAETAWPEGVVELLLLFADTDEAFEALLLPVADRTLFNSEPIDSSLCHLELRAALICVHSSFLHDLDLLIDCSQSLNCALPSGVIWNALRADKIVLVNSS